MAPSLGRTDMNGTYEVVATRSGDWWTVEVASGLPADVVGVSQARRLTEVPTVARDLIGDILDIDPATIDVNLLVQLSSELQEWVDCYRDAQVVENMARSEAAQVPCPPPAAEMPELWGSCRGEITINADLTEPTG